jgi:glyoxylase-like metal-dependent hydrolase (beta-lactamase superfamily II)
MRDPGAVRVELLEGPQRLFDAIDLIPTNGHTRGMQLLRFDHAGDTFLHAADIVPTYGHAPVAYVMGYDMEPMTSIEEKRAVLTEVAQGGFLSTGHDPDHGFARIAARGHDKFEAYDKVEGGPAT